LVLRTFTVEVIYFGNVEISETLTYRINDGVYLPKNPTYEAQHPMPTDLTGWDNNALVDGSPPSSPMRPEFKTMMEDEVMRILYCEGGYEFDDTGNYLRSCKHCCEEECVMTTNSIMIGAFDDGRQTEEVRPNNIRHKEAYRQMALTINGGPAGAGNRVQLPACVLSGIRSIFPDADGQYMGHREEYNDLLRPVNVSPPVSSDPFQRP
jgi:hypothetical protein